MNKKLGFIWLLVLGLIFFILGGFFIWEQKQSKILSDTSFNNSSLASKSDLDNPALNSKEVARENKEDKEISYSTKINIGKTTLAAFNGDEKSWALEAKKMQMDEKARKAITFNVTGTFYANKEPKAVVVSNGANVDMETKDILFHGEVEITTTKGEKAWSRLMKWDGARQLLIGWDGVRVWKNNAFISGTSMEINPSFNEITVKGNVSSAF